MSCQVSPRSSLRNNAAGSTPAKIVSGAFDGPGSMCQIRDTLRSEPSLNFGAVFVAFGSSPARPRYTAGPHGSLPIGAAAETVRPSRGSSVMRYTAPPALDGPPTDQFLRA